MTNLKCGVDQCTYNKENLCCLNSIKVGGNDAVEYERTCCESFQEKSEGSFTNDVMNPSQQAEIGCEAENCKFNSNYKCHAEGIQIAGDLASCDSDTCCSSFECK